MNIAISIIIGLVVGLAIGHAGRRQRDKKIAELENEISVNQNVMEAQNDSINRLRRSLEKRKKGGQPNG